MDEAKIADEYCIESYFSEQSRHLVVELSRYVVSQRLDMIDVPADWWSAVKLHFLGEGYWKILPLKAPKMVRFTLDANYPDYPIEADRIGQPYLEIQTQRWCKKCLENS